MKSSPPIPMLLPVVVTVLALADGVLHFALDFILFRGNIFGSPRPPAPPTGTTAPPRPPGGPPVQLPFPLNEMFLLSLIGYVVLVALFWVGPSRLGRWAWLIDAAMAVYVAVIFSLWVLFHGPNPMGLGYLSKGIEVLLFVAVLSHLSMLVRQRPVEMKTA